MPIGRRSRGAPSVDAIAARTTVSTVARKSAPLVASKALSVGLLGVAAILAARGLGPADRGILALYVAIGTWLPLFGTLGVGTVAQIRLVATPDETTRALTLGEFTGAVSVLVIVQCLACPLAAWALLPLVHVHPSPVGLLILAFLAAGRLGSTLLMQGQLAYGLAVQDAVVTTAGSALLVAAIATLFVAGSHNPIDYLGAMSVSVIAQMCICYIALSRARPGAAPHPSLVSFLELVRKGYPAMAISLGQSVTFSGDQFIVGLYLNASAVGVYSVAEGGAELLRVVPFAVGQVIFYRVATGSLTREASRMVRRVTISLYVVIGGIAALLARPLFSLVFGKAFVPGVVPFLVLVLAELGISMFFLSISDSLPRGGLVRSSIICTAGMFATLVLDFLLIPRFGIIGAAWSSVAGYWGMGLAAVMATHYQTPGTSSHQVVGRNK
jgi:O-antigen/teichoic acid export membrane protein